MISQKKIAEVVGMPLSTVSNILNGTPFYKKETRDKVLKAAEELGYKRNRASLAIKRGRSNLITVVHFGSSYSTAHQAIYALVQAISSHGYHYNVIDQRWYTGNTAAMLNELIESRVEGVILIGSGGFDETFTHASLERLRRAGVPVVSLYGDDNLDIPVVGDGAKASFYSMARHLHSVGHRTIILPLFEGQHRATQGRTEGFRAAMKDEGAFYHFDEETFARKWPRLRRGCGDEKIGVIVSLPLDRMQYDIQQASFEVARRLIKADLLPDAMMCANDRGACGVFNALFEAGKRVPSDLAVTGADDDEFGRMLMFRLTTIRMDIRDSAVATVELLMHCIRGETPTEQETFRPAQLVLRQSCGRLSTGDAHDEKLVLVDMPPEG